MALASLRAPGSECRTPARAKSKHLVKEVLDSSQEQMLPRHTFTSPIATVQFQPDVPLLPATQRPLLQLLQSLRMIQEDLEELEPL